MREVAFAAQWTKQNCHLQYHFSDVVRSPFHTPYQKVSLCFKRTMQWLGELIVYPAHQFAKSIIVGGVRDTKEQVLQVNKEWRAKWETSTSAQHALLRRAYEPEIIKATAPNGDRFEGTLYRSKRSVNRDLPTIICPNPNHGGLSRSEGWDWLLKKGTKSALPFNVLVFDYASAAVQGGALHHPEDLTLNTDTFYQYAQQSGISESNLHFFGFCLGANPLASVAEMHPQSGRFVSLNTPYNLAELMYRSPFNHQELQRRKVPMIPLMKKITYLYLKWSRWSMDIGRALNAISHRALFVHHRDDSFVTAELRCTQAVKNNPNTLLLKTRHNVICRDPEYVTHWQPITLMESDDGLSGSKKVVNFLLGQAVFSQRQSPPRHNFIIHGHKRGLKDIQKVRT